MGDESGVADQADWTGTKEDAVHDDDVRVYRQQNPRPWWIVLGGVNAGVALLVMAQLIGSIAFERPWTGVFFSVAALLIINAVLVPIVVVMLRRRIVVDFARGLIGPSAMRLMAPAEFRVLVDNARTFPQAAHSVELCYAHGSVRVDVGTFRDGPHLRERNEALLAFIAAWLPVPPQHRSALGRGAVPGITRYAIGRQEAADLLRSGR